MIIELADIAAFNAGTHCELYKKLGAHLEYPYGCYFAVWAPNAAQVSVIGDFNGWHSSRNSLKLRKDGSGIWEGSVFEAAKGHKYKFHIVPKEDELPVIDKADPFAFFSEQPPGNASIIWDTHYIWSDDTWQNDKKKISNTLKSPISIYEIHLPSWRRIPEEKNRSLTYSELALLLPSYIKKMGFTHVEFLPIMEHPLYSSWGYQTTGYYAPSSRYGKPQDFMRLVEALHQEGIGVYLDWVPSHFPTDPHGLGNFDGTHLYEYEDKKMPIHPDWNTYSFDYSKPQVKSFLLSNAIFWFENFHIDGIRCDAVASMLYLDYSRKPNEWSPNIYGGNENIEAVEFCRDLNTTIYARFPYAQTIAEESTAWPKVSRPTEMGGLGFGMKWNMGWMHDVLNYMSLDPIYRSYHHERLLFSLHYAFSENFILPLSHDEVVHSKGSLIRKMPGEYYQQFANLRLLLGYMYGHPGKKLLFMGAELAQWSEWNHQASLDWHLLDTPQHQQIQLWVRDLNYLYKSESALHELDFSYDGCNFINIDPLQHNTVCFVRMGENRKRMLLVICNFSAEAREQYRMGVPAEGYWKELLNSDSRFYGGSGQGNFGGVHSEPHPANDYENSIVVTIPALTILFLAQD